MSRRSFSPPPLPAAPLEDGERPSKSQRKRDMHDLQALGEALLELPVARLAKIDMPERLREALLEAHRIKSHEGRRRQLQLIGKLMRQTDPAPLQEAVAAQRLGRAQDALSLHEAEAWRDRLLASDEAVTEWLAAHPDEDAQQLRTLIRNARKEAAAAAAAAPDDGAAQRKGRAYRELFQRLREALVAQAERERAAAAGTSPLARGVGLDDDVDGDDDADRDD